MIHALRSFLVSLVPGQDSISVQMDVVELPPEHGIPGPVHTEGELIDFVRTSQDPVRVTGV